MDHLEHLWIKPHTQVENRRTGEKKVFNKWVSFVYWKIVGYDDEYWKTFDGRRVKLRYDAVEFIRRALLASPQQEILLGNDLIFLADESIYIEKDDGQTLSVGYDLDLLETCRLADKIANMK